MATKRASPAPAPRAEPVLSLRTIQAPVLIRTLDVVKELVADCNFVFSPKGLIISVMDASHQVYVYVNFPAEMFEFYRCDEPLLMIGVNNAHFHKLIRGCSNREELHLAYYIGQPELVITIENTARRTRVTSHMKLLAIENEILEVPMDRSFSALIEMSAQDFLKICREMTTIGEDLRVTSDAPGRTVFFQTEGEMGTLEHALTDSSSHSVTCPETAETIDETFSLRYLCFMAKTAAMSQKVQIYLEPSFPLLLKYAVGDRGIVAFCLAPKLTNHAPENAAPS